MLPFPRLGGPVMPKFPSAQGQVDYVPTRSTLLPGSLGGLSSRGAAELFEGLASAGVVRTEL